MLRFLRRGLAFLAGIFAFLVVVIGIAAFVILYRPELVVNAANVRWALATFAPQLRLSFDALDLRVESESFWRKHLFVDSEKLCLDLNDPHLIHFCAAKLHIDVKFDFAGFKIRLSAPPTFHLKGGELALTLKPGAPAKTSDPLAQIPEPSFRGLIGPYQNLIPSEAWGDIVIEMASLDLRFSEGFRLGGAAEIANGETPEVLNASTSLDFDLGEKPLRLHLDAAAIADLKAATLKAQLRLPDFHRLSADVTLAEDLRIDAKAQVRGRTAKVDVATDIVAGPRDARINTKARLDLERPPFLKSRDIPLPRIEINQKAHITYRFSPREYLFDLDSSLDSPSFSGIEVDAQIAGAFRYARDSDWRDELKPRALEAKVRVGDLQRLAREIRWTLLQIPAPFYRMSGPIELRVSSDNPNPRAGTANVHLTTDLGDGLQAVKLDLNAEVRGFELLKPSRRVEVRANLEIPRLILELPRLSLLGLPRFVRDSRIQAPNLAPADSDALVVKQKSQPPPFPWSLDLRMRTPNEPIILRSNLISEPVPLKIDQRLQIGSSGPASFTGLTQVLPMQVELFRRQIQVNRINVNRPTSSATALDGLFSYQTSEVQVRIRLLGTTESPQVVWESDPPLSQRQIISIIVFGKSLGELSQEESSSAQNLERAFADGALGVASLFLLASTPIESVSYDPVAKTYAARLKVDGRTSLSLGSDFEDKQSLALRRQLGGAWSIKTELQSTTEQKDQLSTFLEWFKRF
ncbi:MAG: translocation/assembly module TamB domain-containing protein [Bdellovibrionaceae bacterium]|nr:translocation/assembly module TamB domain-containing protein [Pseudobdellovibrionaceae bacterium]